MTVWIETPENQNQKTLKAHAVNGAFVENIEAPSHRFLISELNVKFVPIDDITAKMSYSEISEALTNADVLAVNRTFNNATIFKNPRVGWSIVEENGTAHPVAKFINITVGDVGRLPVIQYMNTRNQLVPLFHN